MFQSSELGSAGECQERANPKLLFQLRELMKQMGVKLGHMTWSPGCNRTQLKSQASFWNSKRIRAVEGGNEVGVF